MNQKAQRLMEIREEIAQLEKEEKELRDKLIHSYGVGDHRGFSICEQSRNQLSAILLQEKLGDLAPFKTEVKFLKIVFK